MGYFWSINLYSMVDFLFLVIFMREHEWLECLIFVELDKLYNL